jgi:hypothetical protein
MGAGAFENYKGILLCQRPKEIHASSSGAGRPFLPPGYTDSGTLGLGPSLEAQRMHGAAREKKKRTRTQAQQQHRRVLQELVDKKSKERMDAIQTHLEDEQRRQKFQNNQARARQSTLDKRSADAEDYYPPMEEAVSMGRSDRSVVDDHVPTAPVTNGAFHAGGPNGSLSSARTPSDVAESVPAKKSGGGRKLGKKHKSKPKWGMTQDEIEDAEMAEANALLEFAEGLDIERYLDDFEVREALSIIKERVQELREEDGDDDVSIANTDLTDVSIVTSASATSSGRLSARRRKEERRAQRRAERAVAGGSADSAVGVSDPVKQLVERVLTQWPHLKEVHSRKSITKVIQDVISAAIQRKQSSSSNLATPAVTAAPVGLILPAVAPPIIAVHQPTPVPGGAPEPPARILTQLKKSKDYVQNLPFMYRCPSI